jgi:hypothetical protein
MQVLSPEGHPLALELTVAPRPERLHGLRIGLLDNTKAPVDLMHSYLADRLREHVPGAEIFHIAKQHPSLPADPQIIAALATEADVVINALGD